MECLCKIKNMKENIKKIIILDYSTGEVYIKNYDPNIWEDSENFLLEHGFKESDCHWMIVDKLNIVIE